MSFNRMFKAARLSSASLHEAAGRVGALPSGIKPLAPNMAVCGAAFTVRSPPGDNLWLHRAIYAAKPGDVLVVDTGGGTEHGYWGEIMTIAAQVRSLAGLVISGGVRDVLQLVELKFPVFATTPCIRGTLKDPHGTGEIGGAIEIGGIRVRTGDLIVGDADGVVAVPAAMAEESIRLAKFRDEGEKDIIRRLGAGETTISIYGLP